MKFKVGDIIIIKSHVTETTSMYGEYESGDIGVITKLDAEVGVGRCKVNFININSKFAEPRNHYTVDLDEIRKVTKLDKVLK